MNMTLLVTTLTAALLTLLLFILSIRVTFVRRSKRISIGDGGEETLAYRVRAQANCAEYAPMGLILIGLAELQGANLYILSALAALFVLGRLFHGYAFSFAVPQALGFRVLGMHLTLWPLLGLAALNIGCVVYDHV